MEIKETNTELKHFGIPGMKWGHKKNSKYSYRSTGVRSAIAKRENKKIDKSFDKWKENDKLKKSAIDIGKKRNEAKISYESDRKNKDLKKKYKDANKDYKKALSKNTTYRKGSVKEEVYRDYSRKALSKSKQIAKDPNFKTSKKMQNDYNKFKSEHAINRSKARKAQARAAKISTVKATYKRTGKKALKTGAMTALLSASIYGINKYSNKHSLRFVSNSGKSYNININKDKVMDFVGMFAPSIGIQNMFYRK